MSSQKSPFQIISTIVNSQRLAQDVIDALGADGYEIWKPDYFLLAQRQAMAAAAARRYSPVAQAVRMSKYSDQVTPHGWIHNGWLEE